ncbi:MAG: alkaline phosphatase family protein [Candidatus Baltobacteraceae bacterium]
MIHPPPPAHVVVIVEENKSYRDIVGNSEDAPYINSLVARAALFTNSHAVAHPSQPNYMALFSGLKNSDGDSCDVDGVPAAAPNLGGEAIEAKLTFAGYSEDLPAQGSTVCYSGRYARKHVPWAHFSDIPGSDNKPFSAFPRYDRLPTIAFVIPNLLNDMHSASIQRGDAWLQQNIDPLVTWAMTHNTLIVLTWDEDDGSLSNQIPTLFIGPMVKPGRYNALVTHYAVLRTLEDLYHLPAAGASATAVPIANIWR